MTDWILVACLKQLRAEFDAIGPKRDHASDGSIGDETHADEVSDHNPDETGSVPIHDADHINEVHAIDVDNSGPWLAGLTMEKIVQFLLARCRSGAEQRLRYVIYNRRIWEQDHGWAEREYTGASAHTEHAHFSASYQSAREASTASWHLEDLTDMTKAEMIEALKSDSAFRAALASAVWGTDGVIKAPAAAGAASVKANPYWGGDSYLQNIYTGVVQDNRQKIDALTSDLQSLEAKIDAVLAALNPPA